MDLKVHLRNEIKSKIRPYYIGEHCESCNSIDELHLHHVKEFRKLLDETLEQLNLPLLDSNDYKPGQVELITYVMLGKHVSIEYMTLCKSCHVKLHKDISYTIDREEKESVKELKERLYINDVVIPYLESVKDKWLINESDINELINIINYKVNSKQRKSHSKINEYLIENNINFNINSKRSSKRVEGRVKPFRYWIVKEI